jgi:hypothetical protein
MTTQGRTRIVLAFAAVAVAALVLTPGTASAAITIVKTGSAVMPFNSSAFTPAAFDAAGADKLVVTVATENKNGGPGQNIASIKFGTQSLIKAVSQSGPLHGGLDIWYLDNPVGIGDIFVNIGGENGGLVTVTALSGTAAGIGATAVANNLTGAISITTTAPGSLVLAGIEDSSSTTLPLVDAPMTTIAANKWANGSSAAGYENMVAVGTHNYTLMGHGITFDWKMGAVEILAAGPTVIPGDTNEDGVVDAADYITLKRNFGRTDTTLGAQEGDFTSPADSDVDWADLSVLAANMGVGGFSPAAVPEPATLGLLAIGALAIIRRRRS